MQPLKKKGRPSTNDDKRGKLIRAANKLFVQHDYDKVSIRSLALEAGVDSALIRYYFQSKLGLFTAMVQETAAPVLKQLHKQPKTLSANTPSEVMATYYEVMSRNPNFPKLVYRIASLPQNNQNQALKKIFAEIFRPQKINLFSTIAEQGHLRDEVDPLCLQISFFSMMVFPFLMPDIVKENLQIEITPEFMAHLAQQNSQLLQHGSINPLPCKEDS